MKESYRLILSRRKTVTLTVDRKGEVVVKAPLSMPRKEIDRFVASHADWIARRRAQIPSPPSLRNGDELVLFGGSYRIGSGRSKIKDGMILLPEEGREEALIRLLKRFSLEVMTVVTDRIARRYGFRYRNVRISSARTRWGSCNREGTISYSFRIALLPPQSVEYIAVHELAHTVVFDHSAAFWQVVERALPDWKLRRKALKSSNVMSLF